MKRIITVILITIVPFMVFAELGEKQMSSHCKMTEKELKLAPYIQQIKSGKISTQKISILYTILQNTHEVCIHQQNGAKDNTVYLSPDGHKEAVYGKDKKLVKDGVNDGSYNYFHPTEQPLLHFSFDISPWIMWGQSRTDHTTVESRIYAYMGDLEGGINRSLQQKKRSTVKIQNEGQIQALAIFIRAIEEGKAESLFELFDSKEQITDKQLNDVLTRLNRGLEKVYENS